MFWLVGFFILGFLTSCSTDFNLEAPAKEIPVIYGILDVQSPVQYVRIQRSFLTNGKDAREMAKSLDAVYYPSGEALLRHSGSGKIIKGRKIDGQLLGLSRDTGTFLSSPNILYEFPTPDWPMQAPGSVTFSFSSEKLETPATAEVSLIGSLDLREGSPSIPLNFGYDRTLTIGWTNPPAAVFFRVILNIYYQEKSNATQGVFRDQQLEWVLGDNLGPSAEVGKGSLSFKGIDFYRYLAGILPVQPDVQRIMKSVDIICIAGGKEFQDAYLLEQANFGITGVNNLPRYSNIKNGIGFLSSKYQASRKNLPLSAGSLDSLREGQFTRRLQFR